MKRHLVGVDIGGSKIAVLARELATGRDLYADKVKTPASEGVEAVLRLLDRLLDNVPGGRSKMAALGVAVPGHVDGEGHVLNAGNLEGWVNVPLRTLLEDRYKVPIYVERDANCGAIGEKWFGAAKEMDDFVFLSLGTGVGAGLFLDGKLYRGAHDAAGEAGDITFPPHREKRGASVSDVVGKRAIKKRAKRATGEKMSAAEALELSLEEPRLRRATRDVVDYLSASVVAICALLDPEAVLFGGGTSNAGDALLERLRQRIPPDLLVRARLLIAGLGAESQLYGALWGAAHAAGLRTAPSRHRRSPARKSVGPKPRGLRADPTDSPEGARGSSVLRVLTPRRGSSRGASRAGRTAR